jgi:2-polyprenyl-3-methyl-5-hydroxy-6-metoxy-1,4-benzoquinol methylase
MPSDSVNQLCLHQARQEQLNISAKYTQDFLKQINAETDYELSKCPTCDQAASHPLFIKNNGRYCHCPSCDHIYLSNPLKQESLIEFYAGYPTSSLDWHRNESEFYKRIYNTGLDLIGGLDSASDVLDIGCSSGYFLKIASERGYDIHGLEPNKLEASYAVEQGLNIVGRTIDDLPDNSKFSLITLWDVLEHIHDPILYLKRLKSHLSLSGLVFVQVPTSDSLAARVLREVCNMFDGIEHLTLFSARSLDIAFEKAGYALVNRQSVISESHALRNYLSFEQDPYLSTPEAPFTAQFLSPDSIEKSGLGYKIQAVYRIQL